MPFLKNFVRALAVGTAIAAATVSGVQAQGTQQPLKILVGFAPGGTLDGLCHQGTGAIDIKNIGLQLHRLSCGVQGLNQRWKKFLTALQQTIGRLPSNRRRHRRGGVIEHVIGSQDRPGKIVPTPASSCTAPGSFG